MKLSNLLMVIAGVALIGLFFFPLWNITLEAPQYPIPLSMDIYISKFMDYHPNDIKNINLMNHYVGMDFIPETIPEFSVFPIVIGCMSFLAIVIGFVAKKNIWFFVWFVLMALLSLAGMVDFYMWEYNYGHNLDAHAIMKFTDAEGNPLGFQPPLWGTKNILNFTAHSYPSLGALFLGASIVISLIAYVVGRKKHAG